MPRIVKEHQQRKNEILDTAQSLFYSQGYENTSVANVIDTIGIAKGTFYHYFKSKAELLDQIVDRQAHRIDQIIDGVLEEPEENAIVELNNIFTAIGEYKAENKQVMLMMLKALYSEENIVLRTKLTRLRIKTVAPKIARVISRGISEGLFFTENPDYASEMILTMSLFLGDEIARIMIEERPSKENKKIVLEQCFVFERAVERILGAPKDTITFCNRKTIDAFFNI